MTHSFSHPLSQTAAEVHCLAAPGNVSPFLHPAVLQILEDTLYVLPESFLQAKYPQDWKNSKFLSTYTIHYTRTFLDLPYMLVFQTFIQSSFIY